MAQVEGELRGRLVALLRLRLEASQDHLLERRRDLGAEHRGRVGFHPQPLALAAGRDRHPEGQLARRQLVEDDPEREEIAARVASHPEELLGREIRRGPGGEALLLREQVGKARVPGDAEVDQHRLAVRAQDDVVGLEVAVDRLLEVQAAERVGDGRADAGHLRRGHRRARQLRFEAPALDLLHHEVRQPPQVSGSDEARQVGARKLRKDPRLGLVVEQALRGVGAVEAGHLHEQGARRLGAGDAVDDALRTGMDALPDEKVVDHLAWHQPLGSGSLRSHESCRCTIRAPQAAARALQAFQQEVS